MLNVKKGEIYYAELDPTKGAEMGGRRPVLIISNNKGNEHGQVVLVTPISSTLRRIDLPSHVYLGKEIMPRESLVMVEHMKSLDKTRLSDFVTTLDTEHLLKVERAIATYLEISKEVFDEG